MMRFRTAFLVGGSLLVTAALFFTDPDRGLTTGMLLLGLVTPLIAVLFSHWARKALHDYPEADARTLFRKAGENPVGAGLALIAIAIIIFGLLGLFGRAAHAQDVRTFIPERAQQYQPVLATEQRNFWPDHPRRELLPALVEQESCVGLKHSRCWSPTSQLKSAREVGAGLGQITKAYRADGSLRFDSIAEMRRQHPALRELSWSNVYQRPDLQLRAMVLESRNGFLALSAVSDVSQRLAFADAAYNGGLGGVQKERRACGLKAGCDPQRWFGNVEQTCMKSRAPIYGSRSACDINREHVRNVMLVRSPKYRGWL